MAAGMTYTPIATQTLSSATAIVTFSSIPSTYTDLVLIVNARTTRVTGATDGVLIQFNTDTSSGSTNYSWTQMYGDGTSAYSNRFSSQPGGVIGNMPTTANSTSTFLGMSTVNINNYANATTNKIVLSRAGVVSPILAGYVQSHISLWRNTATINSITLQINDFTTQFIAGSTFTLYGIAAA